MKRAFTPSAPAATAATALALFAALAWGLSAQFFPQPPDVSVPLPSATCVPSPLVQPIAGVSFVAPPRPVGREAMEPIHRVGAEWVAVLPYGFVTADDARVRFDQDRQWWGETLAGTAEQIRLARSAGFRVVVKPHIWVRGPGWTGDYLPPSPDEMSRWEASYREFLLSFAQVARDEGAELFVVGTELDLLAMRRPTFWRELIASVREIDPGLLTYAANWDAFHEIPFWDALDLIGVDAYFPLSPSATPSVEELVRAWEPWVRRIEEVCARFGKPVFFAEYGYRSIDQAAWEQWELPLERRRDIEPNEEAQVNAYEALFRVWWNRPHFAGGLLWKWFSNDRAYADGPRADYTPQHKPVEEVLRRWHGGS